MTGRLKHSIDGRAVQAPGANCRPHFPGCLVSRPGGPVRPGLAYRLVRVRCPEHPGLPEIAPPESPRGYPLPSSRSRCCTAISPSGLRAAD